MIKILIAVCLGYFYSSLAHSEESVNIGTLTAAVFEKHNSNLVVHNALKLHDLKLALHPAKTKLQGEEKRWVGAVSKNFVHNGKPYALKVEMLKLKMSDRAATYSFTLSIGPAYDQDSESQTVVTIDELSTINGNRFVRLDSRFFLTEGDKPIKLVAGMAY